MVCVCVCMRVRVEKCSMAQKPVRNFNTRMHVTVASKHLILRTIEVPILIVALLQFLHIEVGAIKHSP
jgi:hypothetical protein